MSDRFRNYVNEAEFKIALSIARELGLDHQNGIDLAENDAWLRIDHGNMHMLFVWRNPSPEYADACGSGQS
jgi:hypothetical protein